MSSPVLIGDGIRLGAGHRFVLFAGPCQIESEGAALDTARYLADLTARMGIPFVYKSSFDKANRTSGDSPRGVGFEEGMRILQEVQLQVGCPVMTDVHSPEQARSAGHWVDVLQIPALLARQTDLLVAAGSTGRPVNIKKGQAMAPGQMSYAVAKVGGRAFITERGTAFGHHDIVVDYRGIQEMRSYAPVVFDATHTAQFPGVGATSGGDRTLTPLLARAAVAAGVSGVFIECHPDPDSAPSDGPVMTRLDKMPDMLRVLRRIDRVVKELD